MVFLSYGTKTSESQNMDKRGDCASSPPLLAAPFSPSVSPGAPGWGCLLSCWGCLPSFWFPLPLFALSGGSYGIRPSPEGRLGLIQPAIHLSLLPLARTAAKQRQQYRQDTLAVTDRCKQTLQHQLQDYLGTENSWQGRQGSSLAL